MNTAARDALLERARELGRQIAPFADETDQLRRLPPHVVDLVVEADLAPAMAPRAYGGYEADWMTYIDLVTEVAKSSGSIGWCTGFLINHLWFLHFFDKAAVDEVYAADLKPKLCTSFAPFGKARIVPGGYQLEGAWPFGSGGDHCDWAIVGAAMQEGASLMGGMRSFLLRRDQFRMEDTWHSVGLKGSGSNTITVSETFVKESWTLDMALAMQAKAPGNLRNEGYIFKHSVPPGLGLGIYGVAWGVAKGALDSFLEFNRGRSGTYTQQKLADTQALQIRVGECACEIEAARMIFEHFDALARRHEFAIPPVGSQGQLALGVQLMLRAVDRLFTAAGARGLSERLSLQRHWRDLHAISNHVGISPDVGYQNFGRELMNIPLHSK